MARPLFKFSTAEGAAKMLEFDSIFIQSPLRLNDPFELRPAWTNLHQKASDEWQTQRDKAIEGLPILGESKDGEIARLSNIPKAEPTNTGDVSRTFGISDMQNQRAYEELEKKYRILSFASEVMQIDDPFSTSKEEVTLMWSHYADSFKGVCIVFDGDQLNQGVQEGGFEVDYTERRNALPLSFYGFGEEDHFRHEGLGFVHSQVSPIVLPHYAVKDNEHEHLLKHLYSKSPAWKYENEIRFIYNIEECRGEKDFGQLQQACSVCQTKCKEPKDCKNPVTQDLLNFPSEAVMGVIFGPQITVDHTENLIKILESQKYAHVKLFASDVHPDQYLSQYLEKDSTGILQLQKMRARAFGQLK